MSTYRTKGTTPRHRTAAIAVMVGTTVGFGALSSMTAASAHADWWDVFNTDNTLNKNSTANGNASENNIIGDNAVVGNGNSDQEAAWGSGNVDNNQFNGLSPVGGGVAANIGVEAAVGGFSTALVTPVAVGNGNTIGATLGFNPASSLGTNGALVVGGALGGSNAGAQVPVTVPLNVGVVVPIQGLAGGLVGSGGNKQYATANDNTGATQGGTETGPVSQTQVAGDAEANVENTQNATSHAESDGNVVRSDQKGGDTEVRGTAKAGTGGSAVAKNNTNASAAGNDSDNNGGTNSHTGSGQNSNANTGNDNDNNNNGHNGNSDSK